MQQVIFKRPESFTDAFTHYCPGCGHGIIHRLVANAIDDLQLREKVIGVGPVGCSAMIYDYLDVDFQQAAHGRAPAVATGIKRVLPDNIVFTYQGDGDLAAIGTSEIIHAAARGENITVIFVNNAIFGMTGGQMAPTTLIGQKTQTSPYGRDTTKQGYPLRVSELLNTLEGVSYLARVSVHDAKNVLIAKKAIKRAFETQIAKKGFSLVEVLSICPTNWGMKPKAAIEWLEKEMVSYYPLQVFKDWR